MFSLFASSPTSTAKTTQRARDSSSSTSTQPAGSVSSSSPTPLQTHNPEEIEHQLQIREYKAIFQCFDFNGDKYLDINELNVLLQQLGTPKNKQAIRLLVEQVHEKEREANERKKLALKMQQKKKSLQQQERNPSWHVSSGETQNTTAEVGSHSDQDDTLHLEHQHELNEDQFVEFMIALGAIEEDPEKTLDSDILTSFRFFDSSDSGSVNLNDVKKMMLSLGEPITEEELQQFINEADADGDGTLTFEEWKDSIKNIGGLGGQNINELDASE